MVATDCSYINPHLEMSHLKCGMRGSTAAVYLVHVKKATRSRTCAVDCLGGRELSDRNQQEYKHKKEELRRERERQRRKEEADRVRQAQAAGSAQVAARE